MNFGFRAEVGYEAGKDVTYLKTNTPDFTNQLNIPIVRGSKEDLEIRTLLEDQGIVDFTSINSAVKLPAITYDMTFGMVGNEEDVTLTPEKNPHMVLFGKEGSGALNLIRFWLLWASQNGYSIVSVGAPSDLYGNAPHMNPGTLHPLDSSKPLREQFEEATGTVKFYSGASKYIFLVGADFKAETLADRLFLKEMQDGAYRGDEEKLTEPDRVLSLIHRDTNITIKGEDFTGSDGDAENVTYAVIGDVNEATASLVGSDVPSRNARGIAWLSQDSGETKRVKTYIVPRALVEQGSSWKRYW